MSTTKFANETITQPDITIFNQTNSTTTINCNNNNPLQCPSLIRLTTALKYYSHLDINDNKEHQEIFINFITEVYQNEKA